MVRTNLCALSISLLTACGAVSVQAVDRYAAHNGQTPVSPYTNGWASAASNIQDAVSTAAIYDTVWVGAGRYTLPPNATNYVGPNVVFVNKSMTLRSSNSVPESTIIDGEGLNRGIAVITSPRFTLDGFTVTNCYATNWGGGIYMVPASGTSTVQNCVITDNRVDWGTAAEGGGMWASVIGAFNYVISNTTFRNNRALSLVASNWHGTGGAAFLGAYVGGGGTFVDCLIENNTANYRGGGVYLGYESRKHTFERCVIRGNRTEASVNAIYGGAGVYAISLCRVVMRNCLLYNNWAAATGGAFASQGQGITTQEFYNCTIVSNRANGGGSGIFIRSWSVVLGWQPVLLMYNSIVTSNAYDYNFSMTPPPDYTNIILNSCSFPSNATFQLTGTGNITNSPRFADYAGQDFRLTRSSPCINAGVNQDSWMAGAVDLDGNPRIDRGSFMVDMGCYEYLLPGGTLILLR